MENIENIIKNKNKNYQTDHKILMEEYNKRMGY